MTSAISHDCTASYRALLGDETHWLTNSSQLSAFVYDQFADINWAGFYWREGNQLRLGSFQGKPACHPIPVGKGVCGQVAQQGVIMNVPDVHAFLGHIVCDLASRSELVLPVCVDHQCVGVFDLDAPVVARFTERDQHAIEALLTMMVAATDWSQCPFYA